MECGRGVSTEEIWGTATPRKRKRNGCGVDIYLLLSGDDTEVGPNERERRPYKTLGRMFPAEETASAKALRRERE